MSQIRIKNKNMYVVQFDTGTNINLMPLAAGQLYSCVKTEEKFFTDNFLRLQDIIFRRPDTPSQFFSYAKDIAIIGFSAFMWNVNVTLQVAREVRRRYPDAVIVVGGPSIQKEKKLVPLFFKEHPYVDLICLGEGEDVFLDICKRQALNKGLHDVPGTIFHDRDTAEIFYNVEHPLPCMETIASPYLDGTFDAVYREYKDNFSGIILQTNRGCPYKCTFCTWGLASQRIRRKPFASVRQEIEWVGKYRIRYVAMADSNFGLDKRDIEIAEMFAAVKKKYGVPKYISVSWAKNSAETILQIADIFQKNGIGFRVTLSLQSLSSAVLKAANRNNVSMKTFLGIKEAYKNKKVYYYTELLLGLPMETYESFCSGIEESFSDSVFHQVFIYPLFLIPNTKLASLESREKYSIVGKMIVTDYTKSAQKPKIKEYAEVLVATGTMPKKQWVDSFVEGYFALAVHDDRLAFFVLSYLRKHYSVKVLEFVRFTRKALSTDKRSAMGRAFRLLEACARGVQDAGGSCLIRPKGFGGIQYDAANAIFLELLMSRKKFYRELQRLIFAFLSGRKVSVEKDLIFDLVSFQQMVMAHPDGPVCEGVMLKYDWIKYFEYTFQMDEGPLVPLSRKLKVVDDQPCQGDVKKFLKTHYDIRGVPVFNRIIDSGGRQVFPFVNVQVD